ncbi:long-chain fatty acid--CoA ligase [Rhodococcus qingshengii]|uniref:long-chain fatty acid--CoA ligase n=1 Tax=Rhodococcus qingshengii TaxID=334542 RepID=UPI0024B983FE|nr:long-chain fatty acid--CoA ligase [Rhodococcus qingshengii]MDJ0490920.1 long-chain fatty acid--CoA ligase [Rhodococcus qingshengii]
MISGLMNDDFPLTVQYILRRARTMNGHRTVSAATADRGVQHRTYAEVGNRVDSLCCALRSLGVEVGDRVATLAWNTFEHLEAYLGVPAMGAVLHTVNVRLHEDQIVYVINAGGAQVLLVDSSMCELVERIAPRLETVRHIVMIGEPENSASMSLPVTMQVAHYEELIGRHDGGFEYPVLDDHMASGLCFTSGTTSNPKGVLYSHRSTVMHAIGLALADSLAVSSRDRVLAIVPMFHANGWGLAHAAAMVGADLVLPGRWLQPDRIATLLEEQRITLSGAVPTVWSDLLHYVEGKDIDLSALHTVSCGGSAVPRSLLEGFDRLGVTMLHAWGMTEVSPLGAVARPPADTQGENLWQARTSQGRLLPLLEARLAGDDDEEVPHDGHSRGELLIRGPWVATSYYGTDPSPDSFIDDWLRTGDIATITSDGYIRLVDRVKDLIKSGGEWISSVDLENCLVDHPDVLEACVVARPDPKWGERPLAFVVSNPESTAPTIEVLTEHLRSRVPRWWLPEDFVFVDELPRTSVGKLDKKKLRAGAITSTDRQSATHAE